MLKSNLFSLTFVLSIVTACHFSVIFVVKLCGIDVKTIIRIILMNRLQECIVCSFIFVNFRYFSQCKIAF